MVKQSKTRKPESFGKGKVTPIQVAFIVDRYLCDNNFSETRITFRNEASSFISNSPIKEVPKSLLSLGEMLDEYICLKEQKVMMNQQRIFMEQERNRIQMLLHGMQNVMNVYNASGSHPVINVAVPPNGNSVVVPQPKLGSGTPAASLVGAPSATITTTQNTPNILSVPQSINAENGNFSTPMMSVSNRKGKDTKGMGSPSITKKYRGRSSSGKISVQDQNTLPQSNNAVNNQMVSQPSSATQSSAGHCVPSGSQIQGSSVVKCLFNQPPVSIPIISPVSKTPPRTNSCQSDTNNSPPNITRTAPCNGETTSTCYSVISTKRVMVSPAKQIAYIKSSHCISPVKTHSKKGSKRDHVRSKLDFDASDMHVLERLDEPLVNEVSTNESNKQDDFDDLDFLIFDNIETNFSFSDMLHDLDLPCEEADFSYQPASNQSKDNASEFFHECKGEQVISDLPSTVAEGLSEKDMNIQGPDCPTAVESVTTCKTMLSPEKKRQRGYDKENC